MANTRSITLSSGSNQYALRADNASLSITGNITIEAWVKFNSFPANGFGMDMVSKIDGVTQNSYAFYVFNNAGTYLLSFFYSSDGSNGSTCFLSFSPSLSTWIHMAMVFTAATGVVEFFVNGASIGTFAGSFTSIFNSTTDFNVGRRPSGINYFNGLLDEVRVWNGLRTSTEIGANYQRELAGNETNLAAYYKFNNSYNDATANANNLTPSGTPVFTTDVPFADATSTSTTSTSSSTSTSTTSLSSSTSKSTSTSTSRTQSQTTSTSTTSTSRTTSSTSTSRTTTSTSTTSTSTTLDLTFSVELI